MRRGPAMRRYAPAAGALALLLLAGCAIPGGPPSPLPAPPGLPTGSLTVGFEAGGDTTLIEVRARGRRPMRLAELIGPHGEVGEPLSLIARRMRESLQPLDQPIAPDYPAAVGLPMTGGGGFGLTLPPGGAAVPGPQTVSSGDIESVALLRLADPVAYAGDWQRWRIRVTIGDPPDAVTMTLAAPAPPAGP